MKDNLLISTVINKGIHRFQEYFNDNHIIITIPAIQFTEMIRMILITILIIMMSNEKTNKNKNNIT